MPNLYGHGESRGAPIPTFPVGWLMNKLRRDPAPVEPTPEGPFLEERPQALSDIFWEGAQRGSLGGTVGGAGTRVMGQAGAGYEDFADELGRRPVVFRGIPGEWGGSPVENPLSVTSGIYPEHGPVAFGSTNPQVAATYARFPTPEQTAQLADLEDLMIAEGFDTHTGVKPGAGLDLDETLSHGIRGSGSRVYPLRLNPDDLETFPLAGHGHQNPMATRAWNRKTAALHPGDAVVARGAVDPTTGFFNPTHDIPGLIDWTPSDQYAWTEGVASPAGRPLYHDDINDVLRAAAARLDNEAWPDPLGALHGEGMPGDPTFNPDGRLPERTRAVRAARLFDEVGRDPRFAPTFREKAGGFLKSGAKGLVKGLFNPANLLLDATLGAGVGGLSSMAGYRAGQPDIQHGYTFPEGSLIQAELDKPDPYTGRVATPPYTEPEVRRATVRADLEKERRR